LGASPNVRSHMNLASALHSNTPSKSHSAQCGGGGNTIVHGGCCDLAWRGAQINDANITLPWVSELHVLCCPPRETQPPSTDAAQQPTRPNTPRDTHQSTCECRYGWCKTGPRTGTRFPRFQAATRHPCCTYSSVRRWHGPSSPASTPRRWCGIKPAYQRWPMAHVNALQHVGPLSFSFGILIMRPIHRSRVQPTGKTTHTYLWDGSQHDIRKRLFVPICHLLHAGARG
jgi:hypothetical protein